MTDCCPPRGPRPPRLGEYLFRQASLGFVLLLGLLWVVVLTSPRFRSATGVARRTVTAVLPSPGDTVPPERLAAYTSAAVGVGVVRLSDAMNGASGRLRAIVTLPAPSAAVRRVTASIAGMVGVVTVLTPVRASSVRNGWIGGYHLGLWPRRTTSRGNYAPPSGFFAVTPETARLPLSEHFRVGDFLTHDQPDVWPKYEVVQMREVDKLELVLSDLRAHGIDPSGVHVMSGFRTPQYNAGGGDPSGRAALSRHMYGDAADIYIDNDHDGRMDDLNHDGRVNLQDAMVIQQAVDRVEAAFPSLVGGCGVYPATSAHGPFVHIDARGYRARWTGAGSGD